MTTGIVQDQNLEKQIGKQMGCMAGFFQIFDRHQILTGKRLYSTRRLLSTPATESTSETEKNVGSPAMSGELENQTQGRSAPSPEGFKQSPVPEMRSPVPELSTTVENPPKSPLPLPIFELKEGTRSSWKFSKEAPRLSLDSRAVVDAKGSLKPREIRTNAAILSVNRETSVDGVDDGDKQRRSPGVIARLMGLEPLAGSDPEPLAKKAELRRSASESRGRDLFQYRFIDGVNFQLKQNQQSNLQSDISNNVIGENGTTQDQANNSRSGNSKEYSARNARGEPAKVPYRGTVQRKCFYDSADFFPEPKQTVSICGEIEKRLRLRGIHEPLKDLETLKQILEALQLKGLLHSNCKKHSDSRNFICDRSFPQEESPIVVMRPARSAATARRIGNDSPTSGYRSRTLPGRSSNNSCESLPLLSPKNDRKVRNRGGTGRNAISPTRSESSLKSPGRRPLTVETKRRGNEPAEQRRVSPVHSPKLALRRTGSDQGTNRSRVNKKQPAEIYQKEEVVFAPAEDELSTVSDSTISTSSPTDMERFKMEEHKEGKSLLERCDKLLSSIAEITATDLQPSPVSVLDSSFYKEESPSPIMKRSIDFREFVESEDDMWSSAISSVESKSDDCDFIYISDILRASNIFPEESDVFLLLEKQQYLKGKDTSKVSSLQRRLIFDTINEILNRKRQLPPWKVISWTNLNPGQTSLQQVWSEFQKIRERDTSEDLFEVICTVLKKDLAAGDAINGWGDCPVEMSEAVLDIERLIFKDLISETIQDLAAFAGKRNKIAVLRRKLVF
ncbi:hypothetical protein SLE2022_207790 [Rubroshorea leprosula]